MAQQEGTGTLEGRDPDLFVLPVDPELVCPICSCVLRDPLDTPCGHTFCEYCIRRAIVGQGSSGGDKLRCPQCRGTIADEDQLRPVNQALKGMLKRLVSHCDHYHPQLSGKGMGCQWQGEWSKLVDHLHSECEYHPVGCPLAKYGCNAYTINRSEIEGHLCSTPSATAKHINALCDALTSVNQQLKQANQTIEVLRQEVSVSLPKAQNTLIKNNGNIQPFPATTNNNLSIVSTGPSSNTSISSQSSSSIPGPIPRHGCYSYITELVDLPPRTHPVEFQLGGFSWALFFIEGSMDYGPFIRLIGGPNSGTPVVTADWRVIIKGNKADSTATSWTIARDVFKVGVAWGPKTNCKTEDEFMAKAEVDLTLENPFKVSLKLYIHTVAPSSNSEST